jgi:hypothetical protein
LVGASVGDLVGESVGELVGASVGEFVGALVGELVGPSVGDAVGALVGDLVGVSVGALVGASVGAEVHMFSSQRGSFANGFRILMLQETPIAADSTLGASKNEHVPAEYSKKSQSSSTKHLLLQAFSDATSVLEGGPVRSFEFTGVPVQLVSHLRWKQVSCTVTLTVGELVGEPVGSLVGVTVGQLVG